MRARLPFQLIPIMSQELIRSIDQLKQSQKDSMEQIYQTLKLLIEILEYFISDAQATNARRNYKILITKKFNPLILQLKSLDSSNKDFCTIFLHILYLLAGYINIYLEKDFGNSWRRLLHSASINRRRILCDFMFCIRSLIEAIISLQESSENKNDSEKGPTPEQLVSGYTEIFKKFKNTYKNPKSLRPKDLFAISYDLLNLISLSQNSSKMHQFMRNSSLQHEESFDRLHVNKLILFHNTLIELFSPKFECFEDMTKVKKPFIKWQKATMDKLEMEIDKKTK